MSVAKASITLLSKNKVPLCYIERGLETKAANIVLVSQDDSED